MKKKKNLMDFMKRVITGFMKEGRPGTAHVYQSTYNRVLDFMGGRPLPFAELTPSWLKAFQNYLLSWQLQWNSISTYMRMLRAVYFRAVDEGLAPARFRLFHGVYTQSMPDSYVACRSRCRNIPDWRRQESFSCCCLCCGEFRL